MSLTKPFLSQLDTTNINNSVIASNTDVNTVQSNLDSFGSYSNSTFSTVSNAAELATSIASAGTGSADSVQDNLDSFASYANSAFVSTAGGGASGAVNSTVFTLTENNITTFNVSYTANDEGVYVFKNGIKLLQNLDYFANTGSNISLIESTTNGDVVEISVITQSLSTSAIQSNLDAFGSYANSTFSTTSNAAELALGIVNATGTDFTTEINSVQGNLDSFASYANTSFTTNTHIDTKIAELVDSAPAALDTLNELAAALGDDANFSTTIVNSIGSVQSNLDSFASYSNTNFVTITDSGVAGAVNSTVFTLTENTSTFNVSYTAYDEGVYVFLNGVKLLQNLDYFANTGSNVTLIEPAANGDVVEVSVITQAIGSFTADSVQSNLDSFGTYANSTFSTTSNAAELATGIVNATGTDFTPEINTVQDNLDSFASYSNSTFSTISNAAELATGISSSASASWAEKTADYTLAVSDHIFANTLNGSLVFTLPSSPSLGDEIRIIDAAGEASSNTITVYGNGEKIQGDSSNLTITTSFASFGLVYFNSAYGWLLKEK